MNLHEFQAKRLLGEFGVPTPAGIPAQSPTEAARAAAAIGGETFMVKAQVHAGGRGKAGGIRMAHGPEEVERIAREMIGTRLVTKQTGAKGQPIDTVLIEETTEVEAEFYVSFLVDRGKRRIAIIASAAGGMNIEEVAAKTPDKIVTISIEPSVGLQPFQVRRIGFAFRLAGERIEQLGNILHGAYRAMVSKDLSLVELNPLASIKGRGLLALDAKISIDDNALFRHADLARLHDPSQQDEKENKAKKFDLSYVSLDGNIACMVNGAGLAMATMDIIKLYGGEPANFLDVGGGTDAGKVAEAFKLILSDDQAKAILVNIFGGIVRCDLIAEGIIRAVSEVGVQVPVVVRLEGTNVERGRQMLAESGLALTLADSLGEAAAKAVAAVR